MILLNGAEAEDREVDPKRHRFIGTFRFPLGIIVAKRAAEWDVIGEKALELRRKLEKKIITAEELWAGYQELPSSLPCPCGNHLIDPYKNVVLEHYQLGHFDLPQYVNI